MMRFYLKCFGEIIYCKMLLHISHQFLSKNQLLGRMFFMLTNQKINLLSSPYQAQKRGCLIINGMKILNFEKLKKRPRENLEKHVVLKFGFSRMKTVAGWWSSHERHFTPTANHEVPDKTLLDRQSTNLLTLIFPNKRFVAQRFALD